MTPNATKQEHPQGDRQAGFTLLELLVGLVVLGFILAGLTQSVRFGLRAGETQSRLSDGRGDLDAVDRTLRRLIEQADPGTAHTKASLQGTAGRMVLTSELPAAAAVERHAGIAIGVDAAHRLMLRWATHRHAVEFEQPVPHAAELLHGVAGLEIAYWRGGWQTSWDDASLPAMVRIRILFPAGDARHWPDIVAAPLRQKIGS